MPRISAIKVIDKAILPIVLVLGSKFVTVFLLTIFFGFAWSFDNEVKNRLLIFSFEKFTDLVIISTVSDSIAVLTACTGLAWVIFRSSTFRKDKIHPVVEVKIRQKAQESLILEKEDSQHETTVWLVISWFLLFFVLNNVLVGITSFFVLGMGVGVNLALTIAFYKELTDG
jgi:hypothetical protein